MASYHDLLALFAVSLSPDASMRKQAESQLRAIESNDGFLSEVLKLIAQSDADSHTQAARQSAAVYFKNRIQGYWRASLGKPTTTPIPPADGDFVRSHILEALVHSPPRIQSILNPALCVIISTDFPDKWPSLVPSLLQLLDNPNPAAMMTGLRGLIEVYKLLRWNANEMKIDFDSLLSTTLPALLTLVQRVISEADQPNSSESAGMSAAERNAITGTLLYMSFKAYKWSIHFQLTTIHQTTIVPWGQVLTSVAQRPLGGLLGQPEDEVERSKWGWWKAKKWACYILNRLFSRYGSPSQLPSRFKHYVPFAQRFITFFAPEIVKVHLQSVDLYIQGQQWLSPKVICHILAFFEESVRSKETWTILKPHIDTLISRFVFPLMCISEEELIEFNEEPEQYVRVHFGEFVDDYIKSPGSSATDFVLGLAKARKKSMFVGLLGFINHVCSKYPSERTAREKDGAIRMLGHLSSVITETKSLQSDIEKFLVTFVLLEFNSPHAFLRCRVCEVMSNFEHFNRNWENEDNLNVVYDGILKCLADPSLPVRVQAALALPGIIEYDQVKRALVPRLGQVMKELLALSNEVDLDNLTQTTRILVSVFSDELLPFSEQLCQSLTVSYRRVASSLIDYRDETGEEEEVEEGAVGRMDDDNDEERALVAMNILRTLQQLVVGLEENDDVIQSVEKTCLPIIQLTLDKALVELYDEALELLDSIQFARKHISNDQWILFDQLYTFFKGVGREFLSEMFPPLDNFITYGHEEISQNSVRRHQLYDMFQITMTSNELGALDRIMACKLADSILMACPGYCNDGLKLFVELTFPIVQRNISTQNPIVTKSLLMHCVETILHCFRNNNSLTTSILDEHESWTSTFLDRWMERISSMHRSHDKKLNILAICCILNSTTRNNHVGESQLGLERSNQLIGAALQLFSRYPIALQRRKDMEEEYGADGTDIEDEIDDGEEEDDEEEGDEDGDVPDHEVEVMENLKHHKELNETDSITSTAWSDEVLWETQLDTSDIYVQFTETIQRMKDNVPRLLHIIHQQLDHQQQSLLESILQQARQGGESSLVTTSIPH